MKVRIEVYGAGNVWRFGVERKRWYGWQPIYKADVLRYCESYIADLSKVREVEWVKKMNNYASIYNRNAVRDGKGVRPEAVK